MTSRKDLRRQKELIAAHSDFKRELRARAFFKIHDQSLTEDLVQDTFTKTWSYLARGGKIEMMKAFLYHTLNNLIVDQYRKQKHKTTSLDALLEKGFEPGEDDSDHLLNVLDGKVALGLIKDLPPTYQRVLHMRYIQNLSLKEMSAITGQSKNTIAVQIHRGLEKLRQLYK